jgi:benzoate membrane transport protein
VTGAARRASAFDDLSVSGVAAGFLAVLVSYSGPLLIFREAAVAGGVPIETFSSWVMAISLAAGVTGVGLSLWFRAPVVTAWSAPGTALLVTLAPTMPPGEIAGAYLMAALALIAIGASGLIGLVMRLIPPAVAGGMMAGILCQFGFAAMGAAETAPVIFVVMLVIWIGLGVAAPRFATLALLVAGMILAWVTGMIRPPDTVQAFASAVFTAPVFTLEAAFGFAAPLAVVTLAGQFVPGLAVLRGFGYDVPARPVVTWISLASLPSALFGGVPAALASITAALCAGPDGHPDPDRRYIAGVFNGLFYILGGVFSGVVVMLISALPGEIIRILAGLALVGAIGASLRTATAGDAPPVAGIIAFLVTASGASPMGVSAAFWGLVIGCAVAFVRRRVDGRQ